MNVTDWLALALCLNSSCVEDEIGNKYSRNLTKLEKELQGKHFRVVTMNNQPLSYTTNENGTLVGRGVAFEFINSLKKIYNFTYTVVLPDHDILGNDSHGIYGMLISNKSDIAAAFLPVMPSYSGLIAYSVGLDTGEWMVMMKRPSESATGSGLLAPFTLGVWMLTLVSLTLTGPVIYLIIILRTKLCRGDDANEYYPLPACIWFVYGALLKQGTTLSPVTTSTRFLFATWWLFITILTAFYTANLTAFLTLSQFTLPINKPKDIGEKHYSWVARKGYFIDASIASTTGGISKDLQGSHWTYLEYEDESILNTWIMKRNYMFIEEKPILEDLMYTAYLGKVREGIEEKDRCTFVITKWPVVTSTKAFAFSNRFLYKEIFDSAFQHIVESGITKYLTRLKLPNTQICPLNLESKERRLKNSDLLLTYIIVGGGYGISILAFLAEVGVRSLSSWKYCIRRSLKNTPEKPQMNKNDFVYYQWKTLVLHADYKQTIQLKEKMERKFINGTEYFVRKMNGESIQLIPVRSPSALLFHLDDNNKYYYY